MVNCDTVIPANRPEEYQTESEHFNITRQSIAVLIWGKMKGSNSLKNIKISKENCNTKNAENPVIPGV